MLQKIGLRLVLGAGVLWGVATLTFLALHLSGGDLAFAILGGPEATPTAAVVAQVRKDYGLDQPLIVQYSHYVARIARGDLGESYRLHIPVARAIGRQFGSTVQLALCATLLAVGSSVLIAVFTARRKPWIVSLVSGSELILSSTPGFVKGILLLLVFSFQLRWLPASGSQGWKSLVLPTLTLALPIIAKTTQVLRQQLEEILEQPFIMSARARGMTDTSVRLWHAVRHAMIPLLTMSGSITAGLLGGAVIAESLFARRGVGRLMLEATTNKDVPVVIGITLLSALIYVIMNLAVDVLYTFVDPRIEGGLSHRDR